MSIYGLRMIMKMNNYSMKDFVMGTLNVYRITVAEFSVFAT